MEDAMSDAAYAYRPGTRPAAAPSRPDNPHLHVVPDPDLQSETATGEDAPSITSPQVNDHAADADAAPHFTLGDRFWLLRTSVKDYWTPPAVFTEQPASLADLASYAKVAPWTHQPTGLLRGLGVGYYRFVGYPYTVISRYREWFAQRPLRFALLLGGVKLAALTGPGDWVVHTVLYPVAQFAGRTLL
jgi:hypothetical protein